MVFRLLLTKKGFGWVRCLKSTSEKNSKQIAGISFKGGRIGFEKESFISFENIRKVGKDVVIISSEEMVKPFVKELDGNSLNAMKGLKVTTVDGTNLGELFDLCVTGSDGKISELIMDEGKIVAVNIEDIAIGADAIMVPSDYVSRVKEAEEGNGRILQYLDTETVSKRVKETVKETVEKVGETIGQVWKKKEPEAAQSDKKPEEKELKERLEEKTPDQ